MNILKNFGIFFANILGLPQLLGSENLWPLLNEISILISVVQLGLFAAVERFSFILVLNKNKFVKWNFLILYSPKFLYSNGKISEAKQGL